MTALDGSAGRLAAARAGARKRGLTVDFVEAEMDEADLPPGAFDAVTLRNVLWTLENPAAALHLARRLLRPGGRLLVSDGAWSAPGSLRAAAPDFYDRLPFRDGLTEADARALLGAAGFGPPLSWRHLFAAHPYDLMGCPDFFVLTAEREGAEPPGRR